MASLIVEFFLAQVADLVLQIASLQRPACCDASEGTDPFEGKLLLFFSIVSHLVFTLTVQFLLVLLKTLLLRFGAMAW